MENSVASGNKSIVIKEYKIMKLEEMVEKLLNSFKSIYPSKSLKNKKKN